MPVLETEDKLRVGYVYSKEFARLCDAIERENHRSTFVHSLVYAYGLFSRLNLKSPRLTPNSRSQLMQFHNSDYVDFLLSVDEAFQVGSGKGDVRLLGDNRNVAQNLQSPLDRSSSSNCVDSTNWPAEGTEHSGAGSYDNLYFNIVSSKEGNELNEGESTSRTYCPFHISDQLAERAGEFSLSHDCPLKPGLSRFVRLMADTVVISTDALVHKELDIVINWNGGWHHAKAGEAAGYCYVNDCVLSVMRLLDGGFKRILYLDLDVHHGDAVQDAFYYTPKVLNVSLHHHAAGFYPCSGAAVECGAGRGWGYTVNVPLHQGLTDAQWVLLSDEILAGVFTHFRPDAIVVQCGVDGLSGDPTGVFNLTTAAYGHTLRMLKAARLPMMVLGGGGYHKQNVARCWVQLTALLVGLDGHLEDDIPEHDLFPFYGPAYTLEVSEGRYPQRNSMIYLNGILKQVTRQMEAIGIAREEAIADESCSPVISVADPDYSFTTLF